MSAALSEPTAPSSLAARFPYCLFLGCLAFCLFAASRGWHQTLLEDQPFRQAQTAISSYFMIGHAPKLAYETPVLGPPWAIPFEFPLYQWLVALLVTVAHTALDPTGRFVSLTFFLISLIPAYRLLGEMGLSRGNRFVMLSLLLVSPFYVYWSRSFLIESTAFCFAMAYLAYGVAFLKTPGWGTALVAVATGTLGALIKITTFAGFLLGVCLAGAYLLLRAYRAGRSWSELGRGVLLILLITVPPLAVTSWWNRFTDVQRDTNFIGHFLTSQALKSWVFGTLAQRLDAATWKQIYHGYDLALGHFACLGVCLPALCVAGRRREILACLALGLSGPLIFTNLYFYHEYYLYASVVFFVAAVAFSLIAFWERGGKYRLAGHALTVMVMGLFVYRYYETFYPRQMARGAGQWFGEVCRQVQQVSRPDDVVLVVGCDWDSVIPYYSRRRALMIPNWLVGNIVNDIPVYADNLKGYHVGALVIQENPQMPIPRQSLDRMVQEFHLSPVGLPVNGGWLRVYPGRPDEVADQGPKPPSSS